MQSLTKYHKNVSTNISPQHWRLQAIKIRLDSASLVVINSYFPNDLHTANFDDTALNEILEEIKALIDGHEFNYLLLLGDLNTDFSRNTGHVRTVSQFKEDYGLVAAWDKFEADFSHFCVTNDNSSLSLIDHFFWNSTVTENISDRCRVRA